MLLHSCFTGGVEWATWRCSSILAAADRALPTHSVCTESYTHMNVYPTHTHTVHVHHMIVY